MVLASTALSTMLTPASAEADRARQRALSLARECSGSNPSYDVADIDGIDERFETATRDLSPAAVSLFWATYRSALRSSGSALRKLARLGDKSLQANVADSREAVYILEDVYRSEADGTGLASRLLQMKNPELVKVGDISIPYLLPDDNGDLRERPAHQIHPQGLARDPESGRIFVSAVEIIEKHDSDGSRGGKGQGYLFVFDRNGRSERTIELHGRDGAEFHPGGMVLHEGRLLLPISPYKPNSHATILEVPLHTLQPRRLFEVDDHIGALAVDPSNGDFLLVSWGAEIWYRYGADGKRLGKVLPNPSDDDFGFQDLQILSDSELLLTGVSQGDGGRTCGLNVIDSTTRKTLRSIRWDSATALTPLGDPALTNATQTWVDHASRVRVLVASDSPELIGISIDSPRGPRPPEMWVRGL